MATNVNVTFTPLVKGGKVLVDQWSTTETIDWLDDAGVPHTWTGTVTYPNDLALMTLAWQAAELRGLIYKASRVVLGIDGEAI